MVVQGSIWLSKIPKLSFKVVQGCTGFYKDVHDRAKLYIVVLGCTKLYLVIQSCTGCFIETVKNYWLIARARKQPIS